MTLEKGYLLYGRYRIDSILGRGGMGSVYKSLDENLGIPVAVKENLFTTEEYARQFRREATILAGLRHSNLPRVTDHFVIAGQGQYLVMDYIDGDDLRSRIDKGNLPSERLTVDWARQICDALNYLHNRQPPVVHRDIKPGNIRVTSEGRAVLVDFGLARLMEGPTTTTGAKAMTPGYSPPEQYGASRTDSRTDIYALAATLYTLLTGAMPEDGLERALGQRTLTPIRTRNPKISAGVATAIEKALEVLPENRFQLIGDFQKALASAVPAAPPTSTVSVPPRSPATAAAAAPPPRAVPPKARKAAAPPPAPRHKGFPWGCALSGLFVLLLLIAGGMLFGNEIRALLQSVVQGSPSLSALAQTQTALLPVFTVTATEAVPPTAAVSTDTPEPTATATSVITPAGRARSIAFASNRSGIPQIYVMDLDGQNLRQLTDEPEGACQPDWSPDGEELIFTSPCKMLNDSYVKTSIFRINADGSGRTSLTKVPGGDSDPAWSPDGKRILVTSLQDGRQHIYVMDSNGDNRVLISSTAGAVDYQARWAPDGQRIIYVTKAGNLPIIFTGAIDPNNLKRQEFSAVSYTTMSPDWSINNYIIYVLGSRGQVVICPADARFTCPKNELTPQYRDTTVARFSPDGQWVLFDMTDSKTKKNYDIYLLPIVGAQEPRRLTADSSDESDPAWRPIAPGS
ncbi:MAG: serine/threonine-protein kinase [Anaerolineales bacterium]|nr:serine/threonine-protein kinase [Anaerolineales bacterium]